MPFEAAITIGAILAVLATFIVYIRVMPEKNYHRLSSFGKWISDVFNFRALLLETLIKLSYVICTMFCIFGGFFMLFSKVEYGDFYVSYSRSFAGEGLALMIAGPIVVRIVYEFLMMTIILVKNVVDINKKMLVKSGDKAVAAPDVKEQAPEEDAKTFCDQCGVEVTTDTAFCTNCGNKLK